jgi:hypothetical protein
VTALETVASRQQARLRPLLDRLKAEGSVGATQSVAIVNRMIVEGTAEAVLEIARAGRSPSCGPTGHRGFRLARRRPGCRSRRSLGETFRSWAIDAMKADRLWSLGLDGKG